MQKRTRIRHIAQITNKLNGFTPVTENLNYSKYVILVNRFKNFKLWKETVKVSRREFEKELHRNPVLVDVYLDHFNKEADYHICEINHDYTTYEYCIMSVKSEIKLMYCRRILMLVE